MKFKISSGLKDHIGKELIRWRYINWIDVYYPEKLFEELMKSRGNFDFKASSHAFLS